MYDKQVMIDNFPLVLTDDAAAETFFKEAEKCAKILLKFSKKSGTLFRTCIRRKEDYEDLVQDCLETLFLSIKERTFTDPERIDGYISKIARNLILRHIYYNSKPNRNTEELMDEEIAIEDTFHWKIDDEVVEAVRNYNNFKRPKGAVEVSQFSKGYRFVAEYRNATEASEATGVDMTAISRCLNHKRKTAGDYIWLYSKDKLCELMEYD